ncbi:hypothetical protein J1N44_19575, partial [Acidovorax temperans]|uniref:hypothetical protein n=1 Tax=Acidovorax temperans TaxID=80878 RepID=UPI001A95272D
CTPWGAMRLAQGTENPPEVALPTQHLGAAPGLPPARRLRHNGGFLPSGARKFLQIRRFFIARYSYGIHQ